MAGRRFCRAWEHFKLIHCAPVPAVELWATGWLGTALKLHMLPPSNLLQVRNINIVANQANEGIAQAEQRPTRRPR